MEYEVLAELKELYSKEQFIVACDFLRTQLENEDHEPTIGHATLEQINSLLES